MIYTEHAHPEIKQTHAGTRGSFDVSVTVCETPGSGGLWPNANPDGDAQWENK